MALCKIRIGESVEAWGWIANRRAHYHLVHLLEKGAVERCFDGRSDLSLSDLQAQATAETLEVSSIAAAAEREYPHPLAPLGGAMEVWAAGVTYESSKFARMAESAEGGDFYARVYSAERPELFFKAAPGRAVGPNDPVRIRADSAWNVPEPELTAVVSARGRILGYTIGNDMSSREIEGTNPLYLPQAKVYRGSCAIGPMIVPAEELDAESLEIRLTVARAGSTAFTGSTSTARMRRTVAELADWLFRENDFPHGVALLTGTGIIPPDEFTLERGDEIAIEIDGIGVLRNTVATT